MVKITIVGGGSSTFTPQLMRLFIGSETLRGSTVTLMDIDRHRLEVMGRLSGRLVEREGADLKVEATTDRRESLEGTDFVITAISVGGNEAWEKDIEIPAKHGVYMPVADSVGPGGMMRAFRHIPVLLGMCRDLEEVSPGAWVLNYTNPVTANTMAMNRHSRIKAVGLCTCSSQPRTGRNLKPQTGFEAGDLRLPAPAAGLNHCAAILELKTRDGEDALRRARETATHPIVRWCLANYGVLPYCPSHWVEFFPSLCRLEDEYRGHLQGLRMKHGTRVHDMTKQDERARRWETLVERMSRGEDEISSLAALPVDEAIEVVRIMEALIEGRNDIHVVNVPNKGGAVGNMPEEAVVEVSCVVGAYGIRPIRVGELPKHLAATLSNHVRVQELTVEAAATGDRQTALEAFLQDPQISARLTPEETERLLNEMLEAHAGHLPQFNPPTQAA